MLRCFVLSKHRDGPWDGNTDKWSNVSTGRGLDMQSGGFLEDRVDLLLFILSQEDYTDDDDCVIAVRAHTRVCLL